MPKQAIQAFTNERKIPYLMHFTRAPNLPLIMKYGLYPIGRVHEIGITPQINDQLRLDGHRSSTSLSIAFPNCRMLWKYRMENEGIYWAILVLDPSILWTKTCAFCRHNAADGRISNQPIASLMTPQAFSGMFDEIDGLASRDEQKLKLCDPTDVQAEVLVFDVIEPHYIIGVVFETNKTRDAYTPHLGDRKTYVHPNNKGVFATRKYARLVHQ